MAVRHSVTPLLSVFRVPVCISTVVCYVVLGFLALIGSTRRFVREGLLHEHHRPAEPFTEVTVVW